MNFQKVPAQKIKQTYILYKRSKIYGWLLSNEGGTCKASEGSFQTEFKTVQCDLWLDFFGSWAAVAAVALAAVSDHTLSGIGGEFHGGEPVKVNFQYFSIIQILCQMRWVIFKDWKWMVLFRLKRKSVLNSKISFGPENFLKQFAKKLKRQSCTKKWWAMVTYACFLGNSFLALRS